MTRTYFFIERKKESTDRYNPVEIDDNGVLAVYIGRERAEARLSELVPPGEDPARWGNYRVRSSTFDETHALRVA